MNDQGSAAGSESRIQDPPIDTSIPSETKQSTARARLGRLLEALSEKLGSKYLGLLTLKRGRVSESLGGVPRKMHRVANETQLVLELIDDFVDGTYRQIPWHSMAVLAGAVLYSISPADVVPDTLPLIGVLDDLAVIAVAVRLVRRDLRAYCRFKGYPEDEYF
jgi:uncharacterized membrane protein YkvA (DUF1232 family)